MWNLSTCFFIANKSFTSWAKLCHDSEIRWPHFSRPTKQTRTKVFARNSQQQKWTDWRNQVNCWSLWKGNEERRSIWCGIIMRLTWKIISWDIGMWMWRLSWRLVFFINTSSFFVKSDDEQLCRSTWGKYAVFWVTLVHALQASSKVSVFIVSSSTNSWTWESNERCKLALTTTFSLSAVFSCLCAMPEQSGNSVSLEIRWRRVPSSLLIWCTQSRWRPQCSLASTRITKQQDWVCIWVDNWTKTDNLSKIDK